MPTSTAPPHARRWDEWTVAELVEAKARRGSTVSVVLPARDEAATVGEIVRRVRGELMEVHGLVDEVVVIDSDSRDGTADVARDAGAVVHAAAGVRPELGHRRGKGEAMWKSLFVTTGDLLVFLDADLTTWDTHFVAGLLGPLLEDADVELVKGFYDRPLAGTVVDSEQASEGGRVTELVARPLLALHWPALADVVQPLAGEWAARRSLLERLPLPTGYAVELGVLVDTYEHYGLDALAQVDLGVRRHAHQGLRDLGGMALEILALAERRTSGTAGPGHLSLRQFDWSTGVAVAADREVDLGERPPALDVTGYRSAAAC